MPNLPTMSARNLPMDGSLPRDVRGSHAFLPRTLRHPHIVGAIIVCAVCCNSGERCLRAPRLRA